MSNTGTLDPRLTRRSIERELDLVAGAIRMVAGGGAPGVTLAGLAFGPAVLEGSERARSTPGSPSRPCGSPTRHAATFGSIARTAGPMPADRSGIDGTVLLVDDDDVFVDLVQRHLEAHGYAVATAGVGRRRPGGAPLGRPAAPGDPGHQPARRLGLVAAPRRQPGRGRGTAGRDHERDPDSARATARVPRRGLPAQAGLDDPPDVVHRSVHQRTRGGRLGGFLRGTWMNDLEILLITIATVALFAGYLWLCDRVR